ncbi:MAG: hypothetical protein V1773_06445 [bacterium]
MDKEKSKNGIPMKNNLWGIILAGSEDNRLKKLIEKLYSYNRPKQYCYLMGNQSLLWHTTKRTYKLIQPEKVITVINKKHVKFYHEEFGHQPPERILIQHLERGTSSEILFPLLKIYNRHPESVAAFFPADSFIEEEDRFMEHVNEAAAYVESHPDVILMLGIKSNRTEAGNNWIECGELMQNSNGKNIFNVNKLLKSSGQKSPDKNFTNNRLLNTSVIIGKCSTIIKSIQTYIPEVFDAFEVIRDNINSSIENVVAEYASLDIPISNLDTSVLEKMIKELCVMEITGVNWSEWGEESQIKCDYERINKEPFPEKQMDKIKLKANKKNNNKFEEVYY